MLSELVILPSDETPVAPLVETWCRALCEADGNAPDKLIGNPPHPRWRAYLRYAEIAIIAAKQIADGAVSVPQPLITHSLPGENTVEGKRS